jgi:hypothetical protein
MLKFRLPFFNEPESIDISKYEEFFNEAVVYGFDWENGKDWLRGKYPFFKGDIKLQCYHGAFSKETRLFVTKDDVVNNNIMYYDVKEYDEKFNYFNNIERFSQFYANKFADEKLGFDHCFDCSLAAKIFGDYANKNPNFDIESMLRKLYYVLRISVQDKKGMFGHGHMFPQHSLTYMINKIKNSDYSSLHRNH